MSGYIARLKKEKEERENAQSKGYPSPGFRSAAGNYYNASYRKRGGYSHGPDRGSYHPYHRSHNTHKFTHNSATFTPTETPNESREGSDTEGLPKQLLNKTAMMSERPQTELKKLCRTFTSTGISTQRHFRHVLLLWCASNPFTGVCPRHGCPYLHDPDKQAVCKRWFYKDSCTMGDLCSLSHDASPHNAPTCLHFQAGRCNNDDCRFAHVRINPTAPNCEAFGTLGYCGKGDRCAELHAHECPGFANTGTCRYGNDCRLGHVHRASRMRKTTRPSSPVRSPSSNQADRSRAPEDKMDTTEDNPERIMPRIGDDQKPHQFTQQADFVPFDVDQ